MMLFDPFWLILLLPGAVCLYLWRMPGRLLTVMRAILVALLAWLIADPAIRLPDRQGTVVVVADRSASMPANSGDSISEAIQIIQSDMPPGNALAVVTFGERAVVDKPPQSRQFDRLTAQVNPNGSNLADALDKAIALIDRDTPGRIVVLSDGRWTGALPYAAASALASRRIALDHRVHGNETGRDLAIMEISSPQKVMPGQAWLINAWIDSPEAVDIQYELVRGNLIVGRGTRQLTPGRNRLSFRDRAGARGVHAYTLKVQGFSDDPVAENNTARFLTQIDSGRLLLAISQTEESGLIKLLRADGVDVEWRDPRQMSFSLDELAGYSAILLEDIDAGAIGGSGMENIAAWVAETGAGIVMTGGPRSFGPGGYFRSPLEPIMPVSMELRREHRKLNMAIVVVLDRSGSMAVGVEGGKTKMDLANAASAEVLGLLSPGDEFGVIAVDSSAHIIAPCEPIGGDVADLRRKVLSIESMGGGIFVYEGLVNAASLLSKAQSETKHIVLFADAADSEEPGDYIGLLEKCRKAGVTVSVIGLGTETDSDANLLKDIALRGEGRCFFTQNAYELPRLFAQDTFMVARNSFIDEPAPFDFTVGIESLMDIDTGGEHSVGGYNLCYIRPTATLSAVTKDGYAAPILASWQAGIGRAAAFCAQADGAYAGSLAQWPQVGSLHSSLARWAIGSEQGLGETVLVTQTIGKGVCQVQIHIDSKLVRPPFGEPPTVRVLREQAGREPETILMHSAYTSPDKLTVDIPLSGDHTVLATVDAGELGKVTLPPVCLPYSPEFRPVESDSGPETLRRLSRMTGGRQLTDLAGIWKTIEPRPSYIDLTPWLAVVAIILFLLEILERRTGLLSLRPIKRWREQRRATRAAAGVPAGQVADETPTSAGTFTRKAPAASTLLLALTGRIKFSRQRKENATLTQPAATDSQIAPPAATPDSNKKVEPQGDLLDALTKIKRHR